MTELLLAAGIVALIATAAVWLIFILRLWWKDRQEPARLRHWTTLYVTGWGVWSWRCICGAQGQAESTPEATRLEARSHRREVGAA